MDLEKAIEYTDERLNSLYVDSSYTDKQNEMIKEAVEYLTFVKVILINMKGKDVDN